MSDLATRTAAIVEADKARDAINNLVLKGDTSKLSDNEKIVYYNWVCKSLGLDPSTRPFDFMNFEARGEWTDQSGKKHPAKAGKEVLYANKTCAEQLRKLHKISLSGPKFEFDKGLVIVTITASDASGRSVTDVGVVDTTSGKDKSLTRADAMMKACTKAQRRATFAFQGLGGGIAIDKDDAEVAIDGEILEEMPTAAITPAPEHLTSEQFGELATLARAMELTDKEFAHYLRNTYPNSTRAEIPAEDFETLFEALSDAKNIEAIKKEYASVPT